MGETDKQLAFYIERHKDTPKSTWVTKGNEFIYREKPVFPGTRKHKNYRFDYPFLEFFEKHLGGQELYNSYS